MTCWPQVFSDPLDAPYRPESDEWWLKIHALRDMLDGLHLAKKFEKPDSYGIVMAKLGAVAGCIPTHGAVQERFEELWLQRHGTPKDHQMAMLRRIQRLVNTIRPEKEDPHYTLGHLAARRQIFEAVEEMMDDA